MDWSKPSKALIMKGAEEGMVIFHCGPHILAAIEDISPYLSDLDLNPPSLGLWVWEGFWEIRECRYFAEPTEYDCFPVGEFRQLTDGEMEKVCKGQ